MIGTPGLVAGLVGIVALVPLVGAGGPDPGAALAARALVAERAVAADEALLALERAMQPALDLGRSGAARVVSGESPPGEALAAAGALLVEADALGAEAASRVRALDGARRAMDAPPAPVDPPARTGELASIGAQLEGAAPAADRFASMRLRAERLLTGLGAVVEALADGDTAAADVALAQARADHDELAAWEVDLVTLPVWVEASGALLDAAEALVAATAAGDARAAAEAADAFALQRDGAASADRALRIAMGEGGAAVTAAPLGRLADLLRRTAEARAAVAGILQSVSR
ncbi:MAG TPA: hypothetical protein VLA59_03305 [Patescibacteria group bacterium]|nr:hypothetical protein [Patescibacteria group bacterium]